MSGLVARYLSSVESSLIRLQSADLLKSFKLSYERNSREEDISIEVSVSLNDIIFLLDGLTFLPRDDPGVNIPPKNCSVGWEPVSSVSP